MVDQVTQQLQDRVAQLEAQLATLEQQVGQRLFGIEPSSGYSPWSANQQDVSGIMAVHGVIYADGGVQVLSADKLTILVQLDLSGAFGIAGRLVLSNLSFPNAKIILDDSDSVNTLKIVDTSGNTVSLGTASMTFNAPSAQLILPATGSLAIGGNVVVQARQHGWTAWTGTADRTTHDTATATLTNLAQSHKALLDDLITHGLIGA